jgi:hypothetical protein
LDIFSELGYRGDQMGVLFDAARSFINRIEALWEEFALFRNPEFAQSLEQADEELRTGQTVSLDDLHHELDADDRRPLTF